MTAKDNNPEEARASLDQDSEVSLTDGLRALVSLPGNIAEIARGLVFTRRMHALEAQEPGSYRTLRADVKAELFGDSDYRIESVEESRAFRERCAEVLESRERDQFAG